ncbi:hypothetical protein AX15_000073 [Amanita polypyramis BW_CC]|nr:hypothetical protein AX15_000073 [Amanita polypyramis BW_CC]
MVTTGSTEFEAPGAIDSPSNLELRPEAGPLPQKRGEIGFFEGIPDQMEVERPQAVITLPPRHPADHDVDLEAQITSANSNIPITPVVRELSSPSTTTANAATKNGKHSNKIRGLRLTTLSICILQVLLIGGVITGWVLSIHLVSRNTSSATGSKLGGGSTLLIILHIVFVITILVQAVFLERAIRLCAERYSYLHPGKTLPSIRTRDRLPSPVIAFAPWNRPPLPTYAAALAQSGAGTGDVEDNLIAAPLPPAYGNTRGSTLLLAGHMRDSLRASQPESALSYVNEVPQGEPNPMSYEQFVNGLREGETLREEEVVRDGTDIGRRREETLAQLERSNPQ